MPTNAKRTNKTMSLLTHNTFLTKTDLHRNMWKTEITWINHNDIICILHICYSNFVSSYSWYWFQKHSKEGWCRKNCFSIDSVGSWNNKTLLKLFRRRLCCDLVWFTFFDPPALLLARSVLRGISGVRRKFQRGGPQRRHSQGRDKGAMSPHTFVENIVILCFERRFSKQNSVIRLNLNILVYTADMGVRRNFSMAGKADILLIFLWLLTMQRKFTYTKKKMSNVTATVDTVLSM